MTVDELSEHLVGVKPRRLRVIVPLLTCLGPVDAQALEVYVDNQSPAMAGSDAAEDGGQDRVGVGSGNPVSDSARAQRRRPGRASGQPFRYRLRFGFVDVTGAQGVLGHPEQGQPEVPRPGPVGEHRVPRAGGERFDRAPPRPPDSDPRQWRWRDSLRPLEETRRLGTPPRPDPGRSSARRASGSGRTGGGRSSRPWFRLRRWRRTSSCCRRLLIAAGLGILSGFRVCPHENLMVAPPVRT